MDTKSKICHRQLNICLPYIYKNKREHHTSYSITQEIIRYNYILGLVKLFYIEFKKLEFNVENIANKILRNDKLTEIVHRWCWFQYNNRNCKDMVIPYVSDMSYDNNMLIEDINFILNVNITDVYIAKMIIAIHKYLEESFNIYERLLNNNYNIILNITKKKNITYTIILSENDIFRHLTYIKKDICIYIYIDLYNRLKKKIKIFSHNIINRDEYIFGLILRYTYLDSKNQQLAIPKNVKLLFSNIGVDFELFGSAINVINNYYCSLFYDIERYFGSRGNFFDIILEQGIYWCNPPYVNIIMKNVAIKLIDALQKCKNIGFIVTIPIWDKYTQTKIKNKKPNKILTDDNISVNQSEFKDYDIYYLLHPYIKAELIIPKSIMPFTNYRLNKTIYPIDTYMLLLYSNKLDNIYSTNLCNIFNNIEKLY